ncbi:fluoride efflux transporter CrcB [SAR202 cluster bacterium AD-804-J14_MRT_500m]|nr:fluoride efflux transporter CrcB [SAR202 cluster bacterium AD-804-J14_MRT_500m]
MNILLLVGLGGFSGAVLRYVIGRWVLDFSVRSEFPYPTLFVNVIGCLLIGMLYGISEERNFLNDEVRGLLAVGFLGGFTTFSAFSIETLTLLRDGLVLHAIYNITLQFVATLGAVSFGFYAARSVAGYLTSST